MRTLYLHIGSEKTGSTSIQYFLENIRSELFDNNHIVYPQFNIDHMCRLSVPFGSTFVHRDVLGLRNPNQYTTFLLNEMTSEFSNNNFDYVISSEFFQSRLRTYDQLTRLKQYFMKYFDQIKVLYFTRDPWEKALSLLSESIKVGSSRYVFQSLNKTYFYHSCSVTYVPSMWKSVFDDVSIFSISDFNSKTDLLNLFCTWLSFSTKLQFDNYPQLNKSLSYLDAIVLDKLMLIIPQLNQQLFFNKLYSSLRRKLFTLCLLVLNHLPFRNQFTLRNLSYKFDSFQKDNFINNLSKYDPNACEEQI